MTFRWKILARLFKRPAFHLGGISIIALPLLYELATSFAPKLIFIKSGILSALLLAAATYGVSLFIFQWYKNRDTFLEAEHFFILAVLALYSSAVFGMLNYGIYRFNNKAFFVDEKVLKSESTQEISSLKGKLTESLKVEAASEKLASELSKLPQTSVKKTLANIFPHAAYKFDLNMEGVDILLTHYVSGSRGEDFVDFWSVDANAWGEKFTTQPFLQYDAQGRTNSVIEALTNEDVKRDDLVRLFSYRAEWERNNYIVPLENRVKEFEDQGEGLVSTPPTLFLYQWTMAALGSDPGYMKPATALTRVAALIYAFLKYIYFGMFVSLIVVKSWSAGAKAP
jgi:hypothetical protein